MTTLTIAPLPAAHPEPSRLSTNPFYCFGRADAYDESATKPLEAITAHADLLLDHITPASSLAQRLYTAGYARRAAELVQEHLAVVNAQADRAHTWWSRKNGRAA